ncbi:MAG: hypothetical protein K940chlam7_00310 [Chlamydiae bacterium]|nr:hypothetical protein [Chlamydiota bacterium]
MATLFTTLCLTFAVIVLCLVLLSISKLITGKSRFKLGTCGRDPTQKRSKEEGCGNEFSCGLCGKSEEPEEHKEE